MSNLEKHIIGACLYPEAVAEILAEISASDFRSETNRTIFQTIEILIAKNTTPDIASIITENNLISPTYLAEIAAEVITVANIRYFLDKFQTVVEIEKYRNLSIHLSALDDVDEMRGIVEESLITKNNTKIEHASKPLKRAFVEMEEAFNNRGKITGIPTGIFKIDDEMSGLHKTDFILLAARPSIGKTALALQIINKAAIDMKIPSLFLTLEMSPEQLMKRVSLSRAGISVSKARSGLFEDSEFGRITETVADINDSPLYIESAIGSTMEQLTAKVKAAKMRHNIEFVVIDYLGLVTGKGSEYEKITRASQLGKMLAVQTNLPLLAVHQLNRNANNDQPTMNELRSSGQLEQDADVIILLHRDKKEPIENCKIIIEKNRHGKTGVIHQQWNGPLNRIEEPTQYR